jgi:hypothetical protein
MSRHRFHASPSLNRASIRTRGLDHTLGVSPWDGDEDVFPPGLYLWRTLAEAEDYAWGLGDPFDIWLITSTPALEPDPLNPDCAYTTEPIPRAALTPLLHVPGVNDLGELEPLDVPVSTGSMLESARRKLAEPDLATSLEL